jgi:hypothetical protein
LARFNDFVVVPTCITLLANDFALICFLGKSAITAIWRTGFTSVLGPVIPFEATILSAGIYSVTVMAVARTRQTVLVFFVQEKSKVAL